MGGGASAWGGGVLEEVRLCIMLCDGIGVRRRRWRGSGICMLREVGRYFGEKVGGVGYTALVG